MAIQFLVVDDSTMSRMLVRNLVSRHFSDWEIHEADCGEAALALCAKQTMDVITVDFNMPGMDGMETAKKLHLLCPDAALAILTANIQQAVQRKAASAKIQFVAKPVTEERLLPFLNEAAP